MPDQKARRTAAGGMAQSSFYKPHASSTLAEIAALTATELADASRADQPITALASLDEAGPSHLCFFDNVRYADALATTAAGACIINAKFEGRVPSHVAVLRSRTPFRTFVALSRLWQDDALRPRSGFGLTGIAISAVIHDTAHLEDDVIVDPLAVIGPNVEIGSGTVIGSGAVIAAGVKIGRDCNIGAGCSIQFSLIGNNVLIHPGCRIGQDGFGFIYGAESHLKVPQTGRVVIQHDVEIGAATTIDRGSLRDTIIGEGTKIDNQVQIGHNVTIGRHCLIAAQCGLAGSLSLGDNVVLGGGVGLNNHIHVGDGAQIAAMSGVRSNVPNNERWGGPVAKPTKQWFREVLAIERIARDGTQIIAKANTATKDEG
ncbi:MAG: UDP-3-O-[3-hydroxymyristoyl] glucosamine N-acyltransferase [Tardiphaga sp.]|nr:UDP-3-O-[3-hydroxymyristoyl] glucosamine N-acyltransferase [Tardiphaga sp.]